MVSSSGRGKRRARGDRRADRRGKPERGRAVAHAAVARLDGRTGGARPLRPDAQDQPASASPSATTARALIYQRRPTSRSELKSERRWSAAPDRNSVPRRSSRLSGDRRRRGRDRGLRRNPTGGVRRSTRSSRPVGQPRRRRAGLTEGAIRVARATSTRPTGSQRLAMSARAPASSGWRPHPRRQREQAVVG